jgi:hypothetical protein
MADGRFSQDEHTVGKFAQSRSDSKAIVAPGLNQDVLMAIFQPDPICMDEPWPNRGKYGQDGKSVYSHNTFFLFGIHNNNTDFSIKRNLRYICYLSLTKFLHI